jgi:hypothetical protein
MRLKNTGKRNPIFSRAASRFVAASRDVISLNAAVRVQVVSSAVTKPSNYQHSSPGPQFMVGASKLIYPLNEKRNE